MPPRKGKRPKPPHQRGLGDIRARGKYGHWLAMGTFHCPVVRSPLRDVPDPNLFEPLWLSVALSAMITLHSGAVQGRRRL